MDHSDHHPTLDPSDLRSELVAETCEKGSICLLPALAFGHHCRIQTIVVLCFVLVFLSFSVNVQFWRKLSKVCGNKLF